MSAKMELLKKIAKENGVTIDQMAASAGISTATLYRKIKAGGGTFTVEQTEKIAACTKMTRDQAVAVFFN
jgi:predicted transcriptional regulator|nr:MAG TPA: Regulatory protein [Caudoviricetes sp.]